MSVFLYAANLVVYEALAVMFDINSTAVLIALGTVLGLFSASFVASTILGSYFYNWFTRWYYRISAMWMGFSVYLFFTSVLYGLVVMVSGQLVPHIGMALVVVAIGASVYGFMHAWRIVVKEVSVTLLNLPAAWQGRRAVWISDLHLGQLHGPRFAARVVQTVNALPHDIIFIGGDLYDGTGAPDIIELAAPLRNFKAPLGTYFVTGNHEEFGDSGKFLEAIRGTGIKTLIDEVVVVDGLQLIGVDYLNATDRSRFELTLKDLKLDRNKASVLLKHEPRDLDIACDAEVSLQISGHTHEGQMWPIGLLVQLVYKGFAYGLRRMDSLQVYTSSGTGTWGPPMRVGTDSEIVVFVFRV